MLTAPDPNAAETLRDFLDDAGYTEEHLGERLDTLEPPSSQLRNLPRLLEITQEPDLLNLLTRWFFVGVPVDAALARTFVPEAMQSLLMDCGLLRQESGGLSPCAQLIPFQGLWVASDFNRNLEGAGGFEHVLPISPAAKHVLRFIPHDPVDSTLDVGTGCGILALVTAPFSREVVATDLNPRAEQFVAFNAALNGFDNIRFLAGNGLQPVADRRFDLIVSNPPFVLAPSKRFMYRDSGMALDAFCRSLAREAPALLREGGRFQMILEWVRIGEQPWQERLQDWFRDSGCDAWVLMDYAEAPDRYALTRLRETPPAPVEADVATYSEWLEYYREHDVSWIQGGILTMRKRGGADNWVFMEKLPGNTSWPVNDEITRGFRVRDLLAEEDEARLRSSRLRLRPDARLERSYGAGDEGWQSTELMLKSEHGFPHRIGMVDDIADFLMRFDGRRTVGEVIDELAGRVSTPQVQVREEALSMVQRMLLLGFLWIGD